VSLYESRDAQTHESLLHTFHLAGKKGHDADVPRSLQVVRAGYITTGPVFSLCKPGGRKCERENDGGWDISARPRREAGA
jgi:hypothetical protein